MYVYLLQSLSHPSQRYVGKTADVRRRLQEHNAGKSPHTAKYAPWKVVVAIWFDDEARATEVDRKSNDSGFFAIYPEIRPRWRPPAARRRFRQFIAATT